VIAARPAAIALLVEQQFHDPKFEVSNPVTGTRRERMAKSACYMARSCYALGRIIKSVGRAIST
jgi:hypothetical protein